MQATAVIRVSIAQSDLFSQWPGDAIARLVSTAELRDVAPGEKVHSSGDRATHLYLIASGSIVFSRVAASGRPFTMGRHAAGDFHGLGPVLTQSNYIHDAVCRERTLIVCIPGSALRELIGNDGRLSFSLFAALESRHLRARDLYVTASVASTRARIADLIKALSARGNAGRFSAEINLSQGEIAAMLGTRRQVVNRVLREMADSGVLDVQYGRITIIDFDKLSLMAHDHFEQGMPPSDSNLA